MKRKRNCLRRSLYFGLYHSCLRFRSCFGALYTRSDGQLGIKCGAGRGASFGDGCPWERFAFHASLRRAGIDLYRTSQRSDFHRHCSGLRHSQRALRRKNSDLLMRFAELCMSIPSILLVIFFQALWGKPTATSLR